MLLRLLFVLASLSWQREEDTKLRFPTLTYTYFADAAFAAAAAAGFGVG